MLLTYYLSGIFILLGLYVCMIYTLFGGGHELIAV